jgi:hypothetical protein
VELRASKRRKRRAPLIAASPRCAVSQICNLRRARQFGYLRAFERFAECNSAMRQIENLRYDVSRFRPLVHSSDLAFIAGLRASVFGF